jgi:hypothetical protein
MQRQCNCHADINPNNRAVSRVTSEASRDYSSQTVSCTSRNWQCGVSKRCLTKIFERERREGAFAHLS